MNAVLLAMLMLVSPWGGQAHAQTFEGLYANSPQPLLAAPLQWLAVPVPANSALDTAGSSPSKAGTTGTASATNPGSLTNWPAVFSSAPEAWAFQTATPLTQLPTSRAQDVWMRFTLAPTPTVDTWYLRIPRVNPIVVSLYSLDAQGTWQAQSAGNLVAPAQWPLRTRVPTFELKTSTTLEQTYFMRLVNSSVMAERPQMMTSMEYVTGAYGVGAMLGVLTGIFSLLAVLSLAAYGAARNTVFLWLAAFVVAILSSQLVLLGFAGWQLWPGSQRLNQNMPWAVSFFALASGAWLMAKASYAKDTHPWIYRLLGGITLVTLLMGLAAAIELNAVPRDLKNLWAGLTVVVVLAAMAWLTLRGNRFNGWLLLGIVPISLSALNRVFYNLGWLAHVEVAQILGMFMSVLGLAILLSALVWRSRATLLSGRRTQALADYDAATGLLLADNAKTRLPQVLLRGSRLSSGCGVLLLRWVDAPRYEGLLGSTQRTQILRQIGILLRAAARDIDSLIRHDDNHFLMLVEGPISREALATIASQIMAASLRGTGGAHPGSAPVPVNLHIAIWQETTVSTSANNVMALLTRRLNMMSQTTQRRVQFIDSSVSDFSAQSEHERNRRKQDVLDKIREIEGEPTRSDTLL